MIHRLLVLSLLALSTTARPLTAQQRHRVECLDTASTQNSMSACAGAALQRADSRLQALVAELGDSLGAPQRAQLDSAQRAWSAYAALQCRLEAGSFEGGSQYGMQVVLCRRRLTTRRVHELAPLLCGEGTRQGASCSAAKRY